MNSVQQELMNYEEDDDDSKADYPQPLGPPPWSVYLLVCINRSGYLLSWEVRVHHSIDAVVFMKNSISDHLVDTNCDSRSTSNNESYYNNNNTGAGGGEFQQYHQDLKNDEINDDSDLDELSTTDQCDRNDKTNNSNNTDKPRPAKKSRRRTNSDGYWIPVCSIKNFYCWEAAVKMWHLWVSGRLRGITNRIRYGLSLFKYYYSNCPWNEGRNIAMAVLPYKLDAIKKWLLHLGKDPKQANLEIRDFIQDINDMPTVSITTSSS